VTPANIMLTGTGVKVVDFGVSAAVGASGRDGPGGAVLGTPAYLAPERLAGDAIGPAADVYGLGVVLYQALTGELPADPLPALPGVPDALVDLCARCLDKEPAARPSSAPLARELAAIAGIRVPVTAAPPERAGAGTGHTRIMMPEDAPADPGPAPGRVLVTGLVFVALFLVGAFGAPFVLNHRKDAVATPGPSAPPSPRRPRRLRWYPRPAAPSRTRSAASGTTVRRWT